MDWSFSVYLSFVDNFSHDGSDYLECGHNQWMDYWHLVAAIYALVLSSHLMGEWFDSSTPKSFQISRSSICIFDVSLALVLW